MSTVNKFVEMYANHSALQGTRGRKLIDLAAPESGEHVVDIGCGTGQLTYAIASRVVPGGVVYAVDPDPERLAYARANLPAELKNIRFLNTRAHELGEIPEASIDLVFSNYVFQWIEDKAVALREVGRVLRPGGRLVMEVVGKIIDIQNEISMLAGEEGRTLTRRFFCPNRDEWVAILNDAGFEIEHADWPLLDFDYANLDALFEWWEGTTHGLFKRSAISSADMERLRADYPGRIFFQRNAFVGVARRPYTLRGPHP
ncbi:class I SAM-dependent methyltransferase [Sorangium sp. So ce861]|uniref:class I SAM-dependent methyltransferase n=1 Tax=Sorangium sp. So ce861 TaxID=3133323 RepID=UPI003F617BD1